MNDTDHQWDRTVAHFEAELVKANTDLEAARKYATWSDPFAPGYGASVDSNIEQVKASREHRDHIESDLKRARQQRDRVLHQPDFFDPSACFACSAEGSRIPWPCPTAAPTLRVIEGGAA